MAGMVSLRDSERRETRKQFSFQHYGFGGLDALLKWPIIEAAISFGCEISKGAASCPRNKYRTVY
jgi:hypothetical protein